MGVKYNGLKLVWMHQFGGDTTFVNWVSPPEGDVGALIGGASVLLPSSVRVINGPKPTFSIASGFLPSGLSLNNQTGTIAGTLDNTTGSYTYTLRATSGSEHADRVFTANVAQNLPPVWNTAAGSLGTQYDHTPVNIILDATDPESQPVTFSLVAGSLPNGLDLTSNGAIMGTLGSVTDDTTFFFTLRASDGVLSTNRAFSYTTLLNSPPVWQTSGTIGSPIEQSAFTYQLMATGIRALTYSITSGALPTGLTLDANTGVISGTTPAVALDSTSTFIVEAFDGIKRSATTLKINVIKNRPPSWTSSGTILSDFGGKTVSVQLVATDPNGSGVTYALNNTSVLPGTLVLNGNTGVISGDLPTVSNTTLSMFTVIASDGLLTTPRTLYIETLFNEPPVWDTDSALSSALEQVAFTRTVSAHDPAHVQTITYSLVGGFLPAGVSLSSHGVISGTPDSVLVDTDYSFDIEANNSIYANTRTFSLTVTNNESPVWSTPAGALPSIQGLRVYDYTLAGTDPNNTSVTFALVSGSLPGGISLSSGGHLSGTATNVANATQYDFTVALTDGYNTPVNRAFAITVTPNLSPVWTTNSGTIATAFETVSISAQVVATDPEGASVVYYLAPGNSLPTGVFLNGSTGVINGTLPHVEQDTDASFTVYADDGTPGGVRKTPQIFTIRILFNSAPVWASPSNLGTAVEHRNYSYQLSATGMGNGPMIYTVNSGTLPAGLTLSRAGLISGTLPTAATDTLYDFTVNAFNGIKSTNQEFTLTVAHDLPPVWVTNAGTLGSFFSNNTFSIPLSATEPNGQPTTFALTNSTTLPSGVTLSSAGVVSGSLGIVANNATYSFEVRVSDGVLSADRAFSITALAETAPNWVTPAGSIGTVFKSTNFNTTVQAVDPQHLAVTYSIVSGALPSGLSLNASTGLIAGITPNVTTNTDYNFTIRASNGTLTTDRAFSMTVQSVSNPVWVTPAGSLGSVLSGYNATFGMSATDPQGLNLTYSFISGTLPAGMSFTGGVNTCFIGPSGSNAKIPVTSTDTTYTFTVQVTNGFVPVQRTFSVQVLKNLVPVWVSPATGSLGTQDEGTAISATFNATDPENQGIYYQVSSGSLPPGGSLNANTGVLSGTAATVSNTTTYNFNIAANDGVQTTDRAFSFTIHFSSPPSWVTSGSLGSALEQTVFTANVVATSAGQPISYTVANASTLPSGLTLDANTGTISGTLPPVSSDSTFSFDLVATSTVTHKATSQSFSITVINDLPPVWSTPAGNFLNDLAGTAFSKTLAAVDPNGTNVTYAITSGTLPGSVTFNPNGAGDTAVLSGTLPSVANNTTYSITVGASDGASQVNRTFSFTSQLDLAPVWSTAAGQLGANTTEFASFSTSVSASDPNGKSVTYALANSTTLPTGLTLFSSNGVITGVLPAVSNALANDTYNFTIGANDGTLTTNRDFFVVVKPDVAPVWVTNAGSIANVVEGQALNFQFQATDPDGDIVTYSLANATTLPSGFALASNGALTGRASATQTDTTYNFTVAAGDGHKATNRDFSLTLKFDATLQDSFSNSVTMLMKFEEGSGATTFVDYMNTHTITTTAGPVGSTSQVQYGNSAIRFNGTGSLSTPMLPDFKFNSKNNYTVECWVYALDTSNAVILGEDAANDNNGLNTYWEIKKINNNYVFLYGPTSMSAGNFILGAVGVNQWQHLAVSKTAGTLRVFMNGTLAVSASFGTNTGQTATSLIIGQGFNGYMDDLRVTDATRYTTSFTPVTAPLPPLWLTSNAALLGSGTEGTTFANTSVNITDPSGRGSKTYTVISSSAPTITVNSTTGAITGTFPPAQQSNAVISIQGMDGNHNLTSIRNFNLLSNPVSSPSSLQYSWRFNNPTASTTYNPVVGSINAGDAVLANGLTAAYSAAPTPHGSDTALLLGNSAGTATSIQFPQGTNFRFMAGTNWTMECWVWIPVNGGVANSRLMSVANGTSPLSGSSAISLDMTGSTSTTATYICFFGAGGNASASFPTLTLGQWNHLAVVRDGLNLTAYTNGVSGGTVACTTPTSTAFDNFPFIFNGFVGRGDLALPFVYIRDANLWSSSKYLNNFTPQWNSFNDPVWTTNTIALATGLDGVAFNATVTAQSFANSALTYSNSGAVPAGITVNANGVISGVFPVYNAVSSTSTIPVIATDAAGNPSPVRNFTVTSLNAAPVWNSNGLLAANPVNTPVSLQLSATDPRGHTPITYTLQSGSLPGGLSLSNSGLISGTISNANVTVDTTSVFTVNAVNTDGRFSISNALSYTVYTAVDAYYSNVGMLLHADNNYTDSGNTAVTWANSGTATANFTATQQKFGAGAFGFFPSTSGSTAVNDAFVRSSALSNAKYNLTTRDWTFECWIRPTAFPFFSGRAFDNVGGSPNAAHTGNIFSYGPTGGGNSGNVIGLFAAGSGPSNGDATSFTSVSAQGRNSGTTVQWGIASGVLTANFNQWYHIALQRSAGVFQLYFNGNLIGSDAGSTTYTMQYATNYVLTIGGLTTVGTFEYPFSGYIDDFRYTVDRARYSGSTYTIPTASFANVQDPAPVWANASGSLGSVYRGANITIPLLATPLNANSAPITYSLTAGALPGATTLNTSNGLISGQLSNSITTDTVDSFTIRATDALTHVADQSFTYTTIANADVNYSNVSLLIHGETTANNNVVIDSIGVNTFTLNNAANVSTAASKFGNSAIFFNGANSTTNVMKGNQGPPTWLANWLSATDWTLEAWINPIDLPNLTGGVNKAVLMAISSAAGANYWQWTLSGSNATTVTSMDWVSLTPGSFPEFHATVPAGSIPMNTWTHVAFTRTNGIMRGFVNGVVLGNTNVNTLAYNNGSPVTLNIGGENLTGAPGNFHGYMDEIRITTGVGRYTANFAVSTSAFPNLLDPSPIWSNSGSLGSTFKNSNVRVQVVANSAANSTPITYTLVSGSLPGTSTLASNGLITGVTSNVSVDTVSTFTLRARDSLARTTDQSFTYTTAANGDVQFSNVSLLLHAEETANGVGITDGTIVDSTGRQTFTRNAAIVSAADKKFGNSAFYFNGANNALMVSGTNPSGASFPAGTDFTVEGWFNMTPAGARSSVMVAHGPPVFNGATNVLNLWCIQIDSTANAITDVNFYNTGGINGVLATTNLAFNTWHHVAVTRQGTALRIFVNGVLSNTVVNNFSFSGTSSAITLGGLNINGFTTNMAGYVDEIRISNGVARYTSNFSVATSAFPNVLDPSPVWANSGSLGSALHNSPINSVQLVANSSTGATPITYSLISGSLPGTTTLASNGLVTGLTGNTTTTDVVSTFTIRATDALTRSTDQTLSYTTIANSDVNYSNVVVLLHAEDTPNAGVAADTTGTQSFTLAGGNASVSAAAAKFGNSSLFFTGVNSSTSIMQTAANPPRMSLNGDFTIETWINPINMIAVSGGFRGVITSVANAGVNTWSVQITGASSTTVTGLDFYAGGGGLSTDLHVALTGTEIPMNTWTHVAISRQGTALRGFVNGVLANSTTSGLTYSVPATHTLQIGGLSISGFSGNFHGYMDEFRITNGNARYTANFSVQTSAFPNLQDPTPVWVANTFSVVGNGPVNNFLVANSPVNRTLTYTLVSGSLANGTTLASNGLISGTTANVSNITTATFTVAAADAVAPAFSTNTVVQYTIIPNTDSLFANVSILLHADDPVTNTTVFDTSGKNTLTLRTGGGSISTAQKKFGNSALAFTGAVSSTPPLQSQANAVGMNFGTGAFTMETWVYPVNMTVDNGANGLYTNYGSMLNLSGNGGRGDINFYMAGAVANAPTQIGLAAYGASSATPNLVDAYANATLTANAWTHVAVTRLANAITFYVNGVAQTTVYRSNFAPTFTNATVFPYQAGINNSALCVGGIIGSAANFAQNLNGYMDDVRITNSVARYTSNFTPPSTPF